MKGTRKLFGAAAMVAALGAGALVGAALGVPGVSGAQDDDTTTTAPADPTERPWCDEGGPRGFRGAHLAVAAEALGMTEDELRAALDRDTSIADVAAERDVEVQAVIDALVASATGRIDEAVAEGRMDEDRAAAVKEGLVERVTAMVEGERGANGLGNGPGNGRGHGPGRGLGMGRGGAGRGLGN